MVYTLKKCDTAPPPQWLISFKFLTDLWGHESNRPTEFRSDRPSLTLSNRCSNFIGQWQPCFLEICKCPHRHVALWTKTVHSDFHFDRTNGCLVIAILYIFPSYSANKWQIFTIVFLWPQLELLHKCSEFGEYISFCSGVIGILLKVALPPRKFWHPFAMVSQKLNFFLDNYRYSLSRRKT